MIRQESASLQICKLSLNGNSVENNGAQALTVPSAVSDLGELHPECDEVLGIP